MLEIIKTPQEWKAVCRKYKQEGKSIGLVPTMGAFHKGHISLMERGREGNDILAVSIFVNPTQFNDQLDLKNYPVTWKEDLENLRAVGVDLLFYPRYEDLYPDNYAYKVTESDFSSDLCGDARPGHFDGVLSVVMKLLNLTAADRAYFGEKDWQQCRLIKGMAKAFFMDTDIVLCPLIREDSGLALSSRSKLLTEEEKKIAPLFYQNLSSGKSGKQITGMLESAGFKVDYLKIREDRILGAVFLGNVRLIDNVKI